jgi:endonuclease/exonuclease/phosphatase family metal-dependent hydrolase
MSGSAIPFRARIAMLACLAALPLAQCRAHPRTAARPGATSLTVMTFNVNFGVAEHPDNLAAIAEQDADLVLLQETTPAAEAAIRGQLSERYEHMIFSHCCRAGGLAVLSKYPIVDREQLAATIGWFPAQRVIVATPLGRVQVINVHLRPPISDDGSWVGGYFSTRSVRGEEMEAFWREADPGLPTIVAGDFNESGNGRAIAYLERQGLASALPAQHPRATTWRWPTPLGTIRAQLDHIVVDEHFAARDTRVVQGGRSDHLPVVSVLTTELAPRPEIDAPDSASSLGRR